MEVNRSEPRYSNVEFVRGRGTSSERTYSSVNASAAAAVFERTDEHLPRQLLGAEFLLGNELRRIDEIKQIQLRKTTRGDEIIVQYNSVRVQGAPGTQLDTEFIEIETRLIWDRYRELENRDIADRATVMKLIGALLLYAAVPFSFSRIDPPSFISTAFARVWAIGGVWLAIVVWVHNDNAFYDQSKRLYERVLCILQINQMRRAMKTLCDVYSRFSLFPAEVNTTSRKPTGDPAFVRTSHMIIASLFYKFVGLFHPLYVLLFITLFFFPKRLLDSGDDRTHFVFLRVAHGFVFVLFYWVWSSWDRCRGALRNVFRSKRVSRERPWPIIPNSEKLPRGVQRKHLKLFLAGTAALLSVLNLTEFFILYFGKQDLGFFLCGYDWIVAYLCVCVLFAMIIANEWLIDAELKSAIELEQGAPTERVSS